MKDIIIIGAGGFAREVKFLLEDINRNEKTFNFIGYVISNMDNITEMDSKDEIIGDFSVFDERKDIDVALGIGNPRSRLSVIETLKRDYPELNYPKLIHPSVIYDSTTCSVEEGAIVCASNVVTVNVTIKRYAVINLSCTIGHEAIIGIGSVLNPTVNISGGVNIGSGTLVGTGAQILQYLTVGDNSVIGAGACVTKDIPSGKLAVGIPAKIIKSIHE